METQAAPVSHQQRRWESQALAKRLYNASPWYLQNLLVSAYGVVLQRRLTSPAVGRQLAHYLETQWLSPEALLELQTQKLSALLEHVYQHVPYYRQVFNDLGLKPQDIHGPVDLPKLPLLSKQAVRQNQDRLLAQNLDRRRLNKMSTSGTTGSPLTVFITEHNAVTERALNLRMRRWAGWRPHQKRATFSGFAVVPQGPQRLPLWRYDWPEQRLFLSPYHMTRENMGAYVAALRAFQPQAIEAYPSYLSILARYLERIGQTLPVPAVFTSSETLFPYQRQVIEERFEAKLLDWYGLTERAASAAQCEFADGYHVNAEKTIVEIVRTDGASADPGEYGEIVGTNLEEYGMPLIRYCSGDKSALRAERCRCGRNLPCIEQIQTRIDDLITTADGRLINPAPLAGLFRSPAIDRGRVTQEDCRSYTVEIVPNAGYCDADAIPIVRGLHQVLGAEAQIAVQVVDSIPCLANGKYPFVVSKVRLRA